MRDVAEPGWISMRAQVVEAVRSGLLSGREVMECLGISSGVLGGWCRAEDSRASSPRAPAFSEVSLIGGAERSSSAVVLLRGGRRVRVPHGFDAGEIVRLVRALESC